VQAWSFAALAAPLFGDVVEPGELSSAGLGTFLTVPIDSVSRGLRGCKEEQPAIAQTDKKAAAALEPDVTQEILGHCALFRPGFSSLAVEAPVLVAASETTSS